MGRWNSYRCSETGEGIMSHEEHEWTRKKPCEWFAPLRNGRLRVVFLTFAMVFAHYEIVFRNAIGFETLFLRNSSEV
jgi:hypothetical protein